MLENTRKLSVCEPGEELYGTTVENLLEKKDDYCYEMTTVKELDVEFNLAFKSLITVEMVAILNQEKLAVNTISFYKERKTHHEVFYLIFSFCI